jgi:hypothetical protein
VDFKKFELSHLIEDTFGFAMVYRLQKLVIASLSYESKERTHRYFIRIFPLSEYFWPNHSPNYVKQTKIIPKNSEFQNPHKLLYNLVTPFCIILNYPVGMPIALGMPHGNKFHSSAECR